MLEGRIVGIDKKKMLYGVPFSFFENAVPGFSREYDGVDPKAKHHHHNKNFFGRDFRQIGGFGSNMGGIALHHSAVDKGLVNG